MPTFDSNGASIAYTDTGPPAGKPDAQTVVFGHGVLFGGWMFRSQVEALRERYRCVTIDWRGQGDSPPAAGGYHMDTLTGDAVALIRELDVAPVHWVGLSMGGFVGQRIAARHGELLRTLTLLDTSAAAEDRAKARNYKLLAWLQCLIGFRPLVGRVKALLFGPVFLADPANAATVDEWVHRFARLDRAAVRDSVLAVANRPSIDEEITGITVPTLVVVGADDEPTPPAHSERIATRVPNARLRIIPDCGHSCTLEQPAAITELVEGFLATANPV